MSSFYLELECFAGTNIEQACCDAQRIADDLDVVVFFDFNSWDIMIRPGDDPISTANKYMATLAEGFKAPPSKILVGERKFSNN